MSSRVPGSDVQIWDPLTTTRGRKKKPRSSNPCKTLPPQFHEDLTTSVVRQLTRVGFVRYPTLFVLNRSKCGRSSSLSYPSHVWTVGTVPPSLTVPRSEVHPQTSLLLPSYWISRFPGSGYWHVCKHGHHHNHTSVLWLTTSWYTREIRVSVTTVTGESRPPSGDKWHEVNFNKLSMSR